MMKRVTCWALTKGIRLTWALARGATKVDDVGLSLDGQVNRVAVRQGIDMLDVLSPLVERLPAAGEA